MFGQPPIFEFGIYGDNVNGATQVCIITKLKVMNELRNLEKRINWHSVKIKLMRFLPTIFARHQNLGRNEIDRPGSIGNIF